MGFESTSALDGRVAVLHGSSLAAQQDWRRLADVAVLTGASGRMAAVLLDVRGATFNPAGFEADLIAAALGGFGTVAIVSGPGVSYGCARRVTVTAELRGSVAAAFQDEGEAWEWLRSQVDGEGVAK